MPVQARPVDPPLQFSYRPDALSDRAGYQEWLKLTAERRAAVRRANRDRLKRAARVPTVSVVVPVYKPERELLESCVASVLGQDFQGWQLCLCDDASSDFETV